MVLPNVHVNDDPSKSLIVPHAKKYEELYAGTLCMQLGIVERCVQFATPTKLLKNNAAGKSALKWRVADDIDTSYDASVAINQGGEWQVGSKQGRNSYQKLNNLLPDVSGLLSSTKLKLGVGLDVFNKENKDELAEAVLDWRKNGGKAVSLYYDISDVSGINSVDDIGDHAVTKLLALSQVDDELMFLFNKFLTEREQSKNPFVRDRPCKKPELTSD
jgi:hypothetical protein